MTEQEEDDQERRSAELEALQAVYGEESIQTAVIRDYKSDKDQDVWQITIAPQVVLELQLPSKYPSQQAPTPRIKAPQYILNDAHVADLTSELNDLWTVDTEVAVLWAEHCRTFLEKSKEERQEKEERPAATKEEPLDTEQKYQATQIAEGTFTYTPPTSKYGQPVRHFDLSVVQNSDNRVTIHHGPPFRPPKSGASETLVAHIAKVTSMDQVHWVLAELLSDKKIAKATHNMIAYKFTDAATGRAISDNDDDGEKGSGAKLAALLELTKADNVIVIVSRWYGGIHLGPARFKWFASVARDAMEQFGFL